MLSFVYLCGFGILMTPVGYQTNTTIYGPGQCSLFDFVKVGTPLNIILRVTASLLIPVFRKF